MINNNTIIPNMPDADYRALPGLSQSAMKALARSPAHYQAALKQPMEQSPAMLLGQIIHHLALTPDVPQFWLVRPEGLDGRTKEGKAWLADAGDTPTVKAPDMAIAEGAARAVLAHPAWPKEGDAELSITADVDGVAVKGRLDLRCGSDVFDVKTTQDARPEAFAKTFYNLKYHVQAALYCDLAGADSFTIFAVETEAPFGCVAYRVSNAAIYEGRAEYQRLIALYRRCTESGVWPGYTDTVQGLDLPKWAQTTA